MTTKSSYLRSLQPQFGLWKFGFHQERTPLPSREATAGRSNAGEGALASGPGSAPPRLVRSTLGVQGRLAQCRLQHSGPPTWADGGKLHTLSAAGQEATHTPGLPGNGRSPLPCAFLSSCFLGSEGSGAPGASDTLPGEIALGQLCLRPPGSP